MEKFSVLLPLVGRDIWTLYNEPQCDSDFDPIVGKKRKGDLLSFKTQYTNVQTVRPLDFCSMAQLVSGHGHDDM